MIRITEVELTLDLPCSVGVLAHDIDVRITVSYETCGRGQDLEVYDHALEAVVLYETGGSEKPGVIRKGDRLFWLFEEAIKPHEETIRRECWAHAEEAQEPDPDELLERKRDYALHWGDCHD
jgi:hypothetical protein